MLWQKSKLNLLILTGILAQASYSYAHTASHKQHTHINNNHSHVAHTSHKKKHRAFNYMQGTASYYGDGDGFNGRPMANGQIFNQYNSHYAAHPTLPLGTKLKVTNLANGRSIYVTVTDRMPKEGRVIDLSTQAGDYLGMHHRGITQVRLQRISNAVYQANKNHLEVDPNDDGHQY